MRARPYSAKIASGPVHSLPSSAAVKLLPGRFRPGEAGGEWTSELVDPDSAGFEHASILTDLDGDGKDELYVASDKHKQVRRYVWDGSRLVREVIYTRPDDRPIFTWNLMPVPIGLVPEGEGAQ